MSADIIDRIVGIVPGDRLDELRANRPVARADAQTAYESLIAAPSDPVRATSVERFAIAYWVSALSRAATATHYAEGLVVLDLAAKSAIDAELPAAIATGPYGRYPAGPLSVEDEPGPRYAAPPTLRERLGVRLAAALEHAHLLTFRPRESDPDALQSLIDAGWTTDGIVTISQLVAFVHFQQRVVAGLIVLKGAS